MRHLRPLLLTGLVLVLVPPGRADDRPSDPPPAPPEDASILGQGVQRTMTLLAGSTPERRNTVRILFYGQSITEQDWSKQVADDLKRRFPHAVLEIENRAIGGFASQLLIRPAEHDLYPFYPDLLIFHVYGGDKEYEQIIRNTRARTTSEVLMQKDHATAWPPDRVDREKDKGAWWDDLMNHRILPEIAGKYGCGLVDIRGPWLDYLRSNNLQPRDLLKDGVHLNDRGNVLMAALVNRYLVHRPELSADAWRDLVRTYEVGRDVAWKGGQLIFEFDGNRVDVVAAEGARPGTGTARVLIDGKSPSEIPGLERITRPTPGPWSPLALTRVDHDQRLQIEDWTLKVTSVNDESTEWQYEVAGSRTGADGVGSSASTFVSKSGRVKIEPGAWFRHGKVPTGYEIKWAVLPTSIDSYEPPAIADPSCAASTTLAQGLANARHTLELLAEGTGTIPIRAFRVYRPPVRP